MGGFVGRSVGLSVCRSVCLQKISKIFKKRLCEYDIGSIENKNWSTTRVDPKTVFEPFPDPKMSQLGPQKVENDPKIESKSNVRVDRNIKNESCSTT